jgi:anoctamin-10
MGLDKQTAGAGDKAVDAVRSGAGLVRDTKIALSIPVIIACGVGLGAFLSSIFILEAFVGAVWEGTGKEVLVSITAGL